jgi:hypothetical protein
MTDTQTEIQQIVKNASPEAQKLIAQVFELERAKLFMSTPLGIVDDVLTTVKDVVR